MVDREDMLFSLRLMGVREGDALLVHSSLSSIGRAEGGAEAVVDALLQAVGESGTVAMSTLTGWDAPFDADATPSAVGKISEAFRRRPGVLRSLHPVHSVAAAGKYAREITRGHEACETGCGAGTPYMKLLELGGKVVLLGVDMDRNTFMHSLEEAVDAVYLRTLDIPAPTYLKGAGTFTLRKFPPGHRDFIGLTPLLRETEALVEGRMGDAVVKVVDMRRLFSAAMMALAADPMRFICHNPNCNSCHWARHIHAGTPADPGRYAGNGCADPACEICAVV